jgi:hypothetical protein
LKIKINLDQQVSTHLAFALVLVLSFWVAWFTMSKAQEIIKNSKQSTAFNIEKRMQKEIPADKNQRVND